MAGIDSERDYIQSIERGFAVLLAFDEDLPNPSLAELAAATGLSRPAVRRILLTQIGRTAPSHERLDRAVAEICPKAAPAWDGMTLHL